MSQQAIKELIRRAGGEDAVARATRQTPWAVQKWAKNGIPERHWSTLRALGDMTVEELHAANEALRDTSEGRSSSGEAA